jgi:hypothetical protein
VFCELLKLLGEIHLAVGIAVHASVYSN